MASKKFGIGFLGAGDISILQGKAVLANPDARLVGVWNRTERRAIQRADEFRCKQFQTPEQLVSDPEIDAVFVLTNLETHLQYAEMALKAGKHVLCEKPVASCVSDVQEMKMIAEKSGVVCMPGHNMIHEEGIRRAREIIVQGGIGRIVSTYVLYNMYHGDDRAAAYPGVVRQIFTHNLYTVFYLAGRPTRVAAFKASLNHPREPHKEDLAMALLEMKDNSIAHISASFASDDFSGDPWTFLVKVIGTSGTTHYSYQDWVGAGKGIAHSRTYAAYQGSITNEVRHFIDVCTRGGSPISGLDEAIIAQKTLEALETSIEKGVVVPIV